MIVAEVSACQKVEVSEWLAKSESLNLQGAMCMFRQVYHSLRLGYHNVDFSVSGQHTQNPEASTAEDGCPYSRLKMHDDAAECESICV